MDILIVDDERPVCSSLAGMLRQAGLSCATAQDADTAIRDSPHARTVLLDLRIPGVEGFSLLDRLLALDPLRPVILLTAHGGVREAVEAMRRGAYDFLVKPPAKAELVSVLRKALGDGREEAPGVTCPDEVVVNDPKTRELLTMIQRVAVTDLPILFEGETGTGKGVFAWLCWWLSDRREKPFVRINCGAIPENLFESELFGHERGAFTGAAVSKPGRVEIADGGTLFLDEVGDLTLTTQAKLLTFLQDGTFERVGGLRSLESDVRVLAATNRDLDAAVAAGDFRSDLFFRLSGMRIRIPPLRERLLDIEPLAERFLAGFAARHGRPLRFSPGGLKALLRYTWPGNVRELLHAIERSAALTEGAVIRPDAILPEARNGKPVGLRAERREFDRSRILEALKKTGGNRTAAAELLGISRRTLQKKLRTFDGNP